MDRILNSPPIVDKSNFKEFFKDYQTRSSTHYALDEFKLDDNKKRVDAHSLKEFKENVLNCIIFPEPIIYVVWQDQTPGNLDIFFSYSTDGGKTFSTPINISNTEDNSFEPRLAAFNNYVYVVWGEGGDREGEVTESDEVFFVASSDFGQTFGTIQKLDSVDFDRESTETDIAAFNDNVYVVWQNEDEDDGAEIFFVASNDNGQTFGDIQNLSNDDFRSIDPSIAAFNNDVYVAWDNETTDDGRQIFFVASNDNGQTFGDIQNLSNDEDKRFDQSDVAAFKNDVYVAWQTDEDDGEIFFVSSNDNGQTFGDIQNLSLDSLGSADPSVTAFKNDVYIVWENDNPLTSNDNIQEVLFRASNDKGDTFGDTINLSNSGPILDSDDTRVAAIGYDVFVVWEEGPDDEENEVLFRASNDKGTTFGDTINLSNSGKFFNSEEPAIATVP